MKKTISSSIVSIGLIVCFAGCDNKLTQEQAIKKIDAVMKDCLKEASTLIEDGKMNEAIKLSVECDRKIEDIQMRVDGGNLDIGKSINNFTKSMENKKEIKELTEKEKEIEKIKQSSNTTNLEKVLNIQDKIGRQKLMSINLLITSKNPDIKSLVDNYQVQLIDTINILTELKTSNELLTEEGKGTFSKEILQKFKSILGEEVVQNIYFEKLEIK